MKIGRLASANRSFWHRDFHEKLNYWIVVVFVLWQTSHSPFSNPIWNGYSYSNSKSIVKLIWFIIGIDLQPTNCYLLCGHETLTRYFIRIKYWQNISMYIEKGIRKTMLTKALLNVYTIQWVILGKCLAHEISSFGPQHSVGINFKMDRFRYFSVPNTQRNWLEQILNWILSKTRHKTFHKCVCVYETSIQ